MAKTIYDSKKTVSKAGRIGWSMTPILADGNIDTTKPVVYCAGATSQAEALSMIAGAGKTSFKAESVTETGTFISYRYGSVVTLDINLEAKGSTRAEKAAAIYALEASQPAKEKLEKQLNKK